MMKGRGWGARKQPRAAFLCFSRQLVRPGGVQFTQSGQGIESSCFDLPVRSRVCNCILSRMSLGSFASEPHLLVGIIYMLLMLLSLDPSTPTTMPSFATPSSTSLFA
ncbi:hypothetical protein FJTKL_15053 [Diaporthe vaccinii]|uniref:Uncharacterized protein n=1 Tax=Diaporthe vaccinii TaxID=105482 RepID=A0ABR4E667_9PEZI